MSCIALKCIMVPDEEVSQGLSTGKIMDICGPAALLLHGPRYFAVYLSTG